MSGDFHYSDNVNPREDLWEQPPFWNANKAAAELLRIASECVEVGLGYVRVAAFQAMLDAALHVFRGGDLEVEEFERLLIALGWTQRLVKQTTHLVIESCQEQ